MICAKFLKTKVKGEIAVLKYLRDNREQRETVCKLLVLLMEVDEMEGSACPNCQQVICQDGHVIPQDEIIEGLQVTNNKSSSYWRLNSDMARGRSL